MSLHMDDPWREIRSRSRVQYCAEVEGARVNKSRTISVNVIRHTPDRLRHPRGPTVGFIGLHLSRNFHIHDGALMASLLFSPDYATLDSG